MGREEVRMIEQKEGKWKEEGRKEGTDERRNE